MKTTKSNEFGIRLKTTLMYRDLTQTELACRINMTDVGISNLVKGKTLPSVNSIIAICKALDVSSDYLLGLTDEVTR